MYVLRVQKETWEQHAASQKVMIVIIFKIFIFKYPD